MRDNHVNPFTTSMLSFVSWFNPPNFLFFGVSFQPPSQDLLWFWLQWRWQTSSHAQTTVLWYEHEAHSLESRSYPHRLTRFLVQHHRTYNFFSVLMKSNWVKKHCSNQSVILLPFGIHWPVEKQDRLRITQPSGSPSHECLVRLRLCRHDTLERDEESYCLTFVRPHFRLKRCPSQLNHTQNMLLWRTGWPSPNSLV